MAHLTRRQKEIRDFIASYQAQHDLSPTLREICEHFGYSSYGTVHKHLKLLEEKGVLRRGRNFSRAIELLDDGSDSRLPLLGLIAAGRPVEPFSDPEAIDVPGHLRSGTRDDEHFVLRVVGTSMVGEGIYDGDFVVVRRRDSARTGEMVVALVDREATLKRFYPEGDRIRLQPANPEMDPITVPAGAVEIQGVVVGLMRRY